MSEEDDKKAFRQRMFDLMADRVARDCDEIWEQVHQRYWNSSWAFQPRDVTKIRLAFVRAMVLESEQIRSIGIQATGWCDTAIEAVILGSAEDLKVWPEMFLFKDESPEYSQEMQTRFARFRQLCLDALDHLNAVQAQAGETRSS